MQTLLTRTGAGMDGGLAVDPTAGRIYWSEPAVKDIGVANLDGSSAGTLFATPEFKPEGVAIETANPKPTNTTAPTIEGTAQVGSQLTCRPGTWSGTGPISFSYQWGVVGGTIIEGATGSVYTPTASQAGSQLVCVVSATDNVERTTATSAVVMVGGFPTPPLVTPLIAGFALTNLTSSRTTTQVPLFTNLTASATLKATTVKPHKSKAHKPKTLSVTQSLNPGRGSITLKHLVRGTTLQADVDCEHRQTDRHRQSDAEGETLRRR